MIHEISQEDVWSDVMWIETAQEVKEDEYPTLLEYSYWFTSTYDDTHTSMHMVGCV